MITRTELLAYLDETLEPGRFQDYCPNGLQVAGREQVTTLVSGVTASQALIEAALEREADAILVHHGYFWRGEDPRIVGIKQRRLKLLLENDINLLAYHLPLDAHPSLGNNAQLARLLDIEIDGRISGTGDPALALCGCLRQSLTLTRFADEVRQTLQREPLVIQGHDRPITTIGWCTGAAQGYLQQAAELGLDVFVSGEISEPTVHLARELGINYIAAGHHATERYGVQALGQELAQRFNIRHHFIDIDNPV
ncbi:Nif3-like dinuclear metal center hexameric protein [Methylophaga sp. OBS4]|nr:Nif3-like dinuclear metal center hexameric protein [Methylophaga sp. OBS4]MCX4187653.1 Nif3-like dinuclear metal center hexameric protein [Methylophaga sp. OBS4]